MNLIRRTSFFALGASLCLLAGCSTEIEAHAPWSYSGATGPSHWAELNPDYSIAGTGKEQSPIDLQTAQISGGGGSATLSGSANVKELINNGHSIQANVGAGGTLETANGAYELQQFHFHSPSEHTVDGKHSALEMHLVHATSDGRLAVVGVMIDEGAQSSLFAKLWPSIPAHAGGSSALEGMQITPGDLLPEDRSCWRYAGSLTTPPCSEGVDWTMMQTALTASSEQIATFRAVLDHTNRPTQPINTRSVQSCD